MPVLKIRYQNKFQDKRMAESLALRHIMEIRERDILKNIL